MNTVKLRGVSASCLFPERTIGLWSAGLLILTFCSVASAEAAAEAKPEDWRHRIESAAFQRASPNEWVSSKVATPFAYDELIYSWHINKPGDTFRLFLKAYFPQGQETEWLDAGFWGNVSDGITNRQRPKFEQGILDMDWLKLTTPASAFRFKVVPDAKVPLATPPAVSVVVTRKMGSGSDDGRKAPSALARVLDVPLRRQLDAQGVWMKDRCQSAALASAMQYFGRRVLLEDIVSHTNDPEYNYPGLWPRVIAAAKEFGFDGYIERFRDWNSVRQALAENKMILCSMRMKQGECKSPPYASMGNHIVVLSGVTDDGRAVVTDSALGKSGRGYRCQWLQDDFETVWMKTKGGVAMVICPPANAPANLVTNLPPFPQGRAFPAGDDH